MTISPRILLAVTASVLIHVLGIRLVWWSSAPTLDLADGAARPSTVIYLREAAPISAHASVVSTEKPSVRAPKLTQQRSNAARTTQPAATAKAAAAVDAGPVQPLAPQDTAHDAPAGPGPAPVAKAARGSGLNLTLPANGQLDPERKSYAERANEQLQVRQKNALAEGIQNAVVPDCLHDDQGGGLLGLPIAVYRAAKGKCK